MMLHLALERTQRLIDDYGRRHCADANCDQCQMMAMKREIDRLSAENQRLRSKSDEQRRVINSRMCGCGKTKVDGICGTCDI